MPLTHWVRFFGLTAEEVVIEVVRDLSGTNTSGTPLGSAPFLLALGGFLCPAPAALAGTHVACQSLWSAHEGERDSGRRRPAPN